jgi:hypothetical protein
MFVHHSSTAPNECFGDITVFEKSGGSHQKVMFSNRHGRLGRMITPRGSRNPNWCANHNSIADRPRQLGMLPSENGGHRHG